tara:strand:- start:981 stop:1433 length:453 start_codon:yes stop_codon:yes gene_type:complete
MKNFKTDRFDIPYLKPNLKVLIETDKGKRYMKVTNMVTQKKDEIYFGHLNDYLNSSHISDARDVTNGVKKGDGEGLSSKYIGNYDHEDIPLPKNMDLAEQIVKFAKGKRKGFTKELVDQWNKDLEFDLHSKLKTYGFMGAKRLNMIFKIS